MFDTSREPRDRIEITPMALNADDLAKRLAALSERFTTLAATLTQTTQQLQASGTVPSETVVEEIAKIRTEFVDVRHRLLEAARSLSINVPAISEVNSLSVLEPVLQTVGQALAAQEKRAALAEARTRVMSVLDRVLTITHADGPNFAALVQCLVKAKEIRQAAQDPTAFDSENAPAFLEGIPAFGALLSIIEGRDALDDDKFAVLDEAVTQAFGRTLAVAAARGKLTVGAGPASVAERAAPAAPKAADGAAPAGSGHRGARSVRSAHALAGARRGRRPLEKHHHYRASRAGASREPVQAPPSRASPRREPVLSREPAQAREPSQAAEQGTQDEAAQWWVSAWARWTSWKGTLSFNDAVKEELGKYNYVLSVPIQKSTDYEEGLLAYGYSILLDHIEHRFSGFVNKALNSLKTFQPGAPGAPKSVGAHLYNVLVSEGRLQEIYPEFVKSVLLAAVPEPGVWTHARILESTTETRIFTHPSNRIGDPEHNSQRLTQERQRFADHRFPVVVAPITARFFAIAADLREPRSIDVKLVDGRSDSDHAWLLTMPPVGRADSEVGSATGLSGGDLGAGAGTRLRDSVGGGVQPGSEH